MISKISSSHVLRQIITASLGTGIGLLLLDPVQIAQAQSRLSVEECNQFAEIINRNGEVFEAFEAEINNFSRDASAAETVEDITLAASHYVDAVDEVMGTLSNMAFDLQALPFDDAELMTYQQDYVDVLSGLNEALTVISDAMDEVAKAESEAELSEKLGLLRDDTIGASENIETLANNESEIVTSFNGYCSAG
ncbi:hypothetical protein PN498_22005 [Oscillatoria sp. CS-180]|uniref:hypothetical protein n=1 Tax=Oscillatoria sp. CS-180 TaxID=3021720 RepID=UPI0023315790|nr:hypothetical protein [Oscillatoria sp. CS-180]MDB9528682.1 hypothetical protein [Oscillatoria sp. CS-180]